MFVICVVLESCRFRLISCILKLRVLWRILWRWRQIMSGKRVCAARKVVRSSSARARGWCLGESALSRGAAGVVKVNCEEEAWCMFAWFPPRGLLGRIFTDPVHPMGTLMLSATHYGSAIGSMRPISPQRFSKFALVLKRVPSYFRTYRLIGDFLFQGVLHLQ